FQELWTKLMRIKEEGARVHPLAARAARRAAQNETGGTTGPLPPSPPGAGPSAPRVQRGSRSPGGAAAPAADFWRVSPDHADPKSIRALYDSYVAARRSAGDERVPGFDSFARDVARHAQTIKSKADCSSVEFRIYSKDNKVTLKARPVSGPADKSK